MIRSVDARLTLLHTERGGRENPVYGGYRARFRFPTGESDGVVQVGGPIRPGQTAPVRLKLLNADRVDGGSFEVLEGSRRIGNGTIDGPISRRAAETQ